MKQEKLTITFAALALGLGWGAASGAGAADPSTTRSAPPPSGTSRAAPAAPPAALEARPAQPGKPDYALTLNSQQEFKNTALGWTFRVENRGKAAPAGEKNTAKTPYGNISTFGTVSAGKLVISVGQPCPETKYWKALEAIPLPVLQPGASVVVPQGLYKMPDEYAGKGCRFQAEIQGPADDANASNNVMHMITKQFDLPDLIVALGPGSGQAGLGPALVVKNIGKATAAPSKFHYECQSKHESKSCGLPSQAYKKNDVRDVAVPSLKPGQSHVVMDSTPYWPAWTGYADYLKEVAETNEDNNVRTGGGH